MNKELENIADEISFRLLATKKHKDYQWLYNTLESINKNKPKPTLKSLLKSYFNLMIDGWNPTKT
jgi:hypothetical protein|tara:strand:+ start:774 stop:968 length:195 start_codon:yes stop_codon:yes gene_type:complete